MPPVEVVLPDFKYWADSTWRGDQGAFLHCVAYSATHRIENSPTTYPEAGPVVDPTDVYDRAQQIDEWPGENYDGTSVRAGAKVMLEKGFISEYQRITTLQEFIDFIRRPTTAGGGPVLIGIDWYSGMFSPVYVKDALGDYRWMLAPTGSVAGGHAVDAAEVAAVGDGDPQVPKRPAQEMAGAGRRRRSLEPLPFAHFLRGVEITSDWE